MGDLVDQNDPSPYPSKEITDVAEDAIADHVSDLPLERDVKLSINLLEKDLIPEVQEKLPDTIRQHFTIRASEIALELVRKKSNVKFGLKAIAVMIAIMITIGLAIKLLPDVHFFSSAVQLIIAGTITILAWEVIGDTYEAYVTEYRGLGMKIRIYEKIARMQIRITSGH